MTNWYMPCPKCGKKVTKTSGDVYKEDKRTPQGWKTVKKQKIYYDCSNPKCDWTTVETKDV